MVGPQNMEEPLWLPLSCTKSLTQMGGNGGTSKHGRASMAAIILYKELDTDGEGMVGPQNMEEPLWLPLSYTKSLTQMGRSLFPTIGMQAK
jgi:hypothetical protein